MERALLLVGYLGEQIEQYFRDGRNFAGRVEYSYEPTPQGTGGALKNAEQKLQEWFVLVNGDTYLAIDYQKLVQDFLAANCAAMIVAYTKPQASGETSGGLPGRFRWFPRGRLPTAEDYCHNRRS